MERAYDTTLMLRELCNGDHAAAERLLPLIYEELRALAGAHFRAQPKDHTLQPTALVHEAYLRLINQQGEWNGKAHFFAVAATAMRQILTDHARRRQAAKRGGDARKVMLDAAAHELHDAGAGGGGGNGELDVVALDELLHRLEALDTRLHRVVELRFFGGLSVEQVAEVMGISRSTVEADWRAARAWLRRELTKEEMR